MSTKKEGDKTEPKIEEHEGGGVEDKATGFEVEKAIEDAKDEIEKTSKEESDSEIARIRSIRDKYETELESGADFWNFDEKPIFEGYYSGGEKINPKTNEVMGFGFTELHSGASCMISNNYVIAKALNTSLAVEARDSGKPFFIHFRGMGSTSDNKPVKKFDVRC